MLFSSLEFVFLFLPLVLSVYYFLPTKARNNWLLLASLFFYAWGEPKFIFIMLISIVFNYFAALRLDELNDNKPLKKFILFVSVAVNLLILCIFKYLGFAATLIHNLFPSTWETITSYNIALPIGISFFTFQAMSYVIDVYRGVPPQKNICNLGLYIFFFPQLIAGPIVKYTTIVDQLESRHTTAEDFSFGVRRFLIGFSKKILLANSLALVADRTFGSGAGSVGAAWLGAFCFTLQLYYDFCGYSDMAIGMGRMFGFTFLENFNYPFISTSFAEFWRRWHVSLGSWFRDYVYFPLGGSRVKSKLRIAFNLAVVWVLTGIWHGANLTFILWGVFLGFLVIVEKTTGITSFFEKHCKLKPLYSFFVFLCFLISMVLFKSDSIRASFAYFSAMFGRSALPPVDPVFSFCIKEYAVIIIAAVLFCIPVIPFIRNRLSHADETTARVFSIVGDIALIVLFFVSISFLIINAHNPFIYFNF